MKRFGVKSFLCLRGMCHQTKCVCLSIRLNIDRTFLEKCFNRKWTTSTASVEYSSNNGAECFVKIISCQSCVLCYVFRFFPSINTYILYVDCSGSRWIFNFFVQPARHCAVLTFSRRIRCPALHYWDAPCARRLHHRGLKVTCHGVACRLQHGSVGEAGRKTTLIKTSPRLFSSRITGPDSPYFGML